MEIRGEYWIDDGRIEYADGDVGDYNHEAIATRSVVSDYEDAIFKLAASLGVKIDRREEMDSQTEIEKIYAALENRGVDNPIPYIQEHLGCDSETMAILEGGGNSSLYAMKNHGWIAVRGHNAELFGYDQKKMKSLASGIEEILENEGHYEDEIPDEEVEFSVHDNSNGKSFYVTLADLKGEKRRPVQQLTSRGDRRFGVPDGENLLLKNKSVPNKWNLAAQKKGVIAPGQEMWRKTSENFQFKKWLTANG